MSQINLLISALCFVHLKCTQHFWTVLSPKFKYLVMQNIGLSNLQMQQQGNHLDQILILILTLVMQCVYEIGRGNT